MENPQEYEKRFQRIEIALAALTMNATAHDAAMAGITAQQEATAAQITATALQQAVNASGIAELRGAVKELQGAVHELHLTCKEQRETVTAMMNTMFKDKGGASPTAN